MTLFEEIDASIAISQNGWCTREKARALALLVMSLRLEITVEIGVFTGKSAIAMALAHKHVGRGRVVCIDPWDAQASAEGYEGANKEWWEKEVNHDAIYQEFVANAARFRVSQYTDVRRAKSDDVTPPRDIGILHVDGLHTIQAMKDVTRFAPNVLPGGIVVMDDTDWQNAGQFQVREAVNALLAIGFIELYKLGTGAVFQKL